MAFPGQPTEQWRDAPEMLLCMPDELVKSMKLDESLKLAEVKGDCILPSAVPSSRGGVIRTLCLFRNCSSFFLAMSRVVFQQPLRPVFRRCSV